MWSNDDTVLFRNPDLSVVMHVERDMKAGEVLKPLEGEALEKRQQDTGMTGPLYSGAFSTVSAEELSWFLRRGYVKSVLEGELSPVMRDGEPTDQLWYSKPRVVYSITKFGREAVRWY